MKKRCLIYKVRCILASGQTDSKHFERGYHRRFGAFFYATLCHRGIPGFLLKKVYCFRNFFFDKLGRTPSLFQLNTESAIFYVHRCTYLCAWWSRFLDDDQFIKAFINDSTLSKRPSLARTPLVNGFQLGFRSGTTL